MSNTIAFGDANAGFQVGIVHGSINNTFHILPSSQTTHEHYPAARPETPPSPSCVVPFRRDPDFVDHGTLLDQIYEKCATPASRIALVGLGGVGKSQLAIEYCYRTADRSPDTWVFWAHASSTARLEQSYREIADQVKLPGRNDPQADVFKLMCNWLRNKENGKWILVLDNVEDATVLSLPASDGQQTQKSGGALPRDFLSYLPQSANGSVLVTSRTRSVAAQLVHDNDIIHIEPMDDANAQAFLKKKLGEKVDKDGIDELVRALEFMPLALVQAASYIRHRAPRCSVQQYLEKFKKSPRSRSDLFDKDSILMTWQISFDHILHTRRSAADLLSLLSFFDWQGIPEALVRNRSGTVEADNVDKKQDDADDSESEASIEDGFEEDVLTLRNYSFITLTTKTTFGMHRFVQLATQIWLEGQGQLEMWKEQYINNLCTAFPTAHYENWPKCQVLFPHAKLALSHQPKSKESRQQWAFLLYKAAWYAMKKGDLSSKTLAVKSLKTRIELLGEEHEDTLNSMTIVGLSYDLLGQWKKAEEVQTQAMEANKKILGEENRLTLVSMGYLATTYRNQGRWKEAEVLEVQVMETFKRIQGEEHLDTLASMNNLALTYQQQGQWKEAEKLAVQIIEMFKRILGLEHPSTLASMGNLVTTYRAQGRWKEAEALDLQVIEMRKKVLQEEHPDILVGIASLALTYQSQGRWKEAEELVVQVIQARKRVLGEEHPSTLAGIASLACIYRNQGRWKEAEELSIQMIDIGKRIYYEEHPSMLDSIEGLALTYQNQGRWMEAEELFVQVIGIAKRVFGEEHPSTLVDMANLASVYWNQGRRKEAEELAVEVVEVEKRVLGPEHPETLTSMSNLVLMYQDQGRWKDAEELELQGIEVNKRVFGQEHPFTLTRMANLASAYWSQGWWDKAEELGIRVTQMRKRVLGEEHPDTLISMNNLASTYQMQKRWKEAEKLGVQVVEIKKRVLPEDHPSILTSMNNLALTYQNQGRWKDAEDLFLHVLEVRKRVLGKEHPSTLASIDNLANMLQLQKSRRGGFIKNLLSNTKKRY